MTTLPRLDAKQERGYWVAVVKTRADVLGLAADDARVPVIIEDENSRINWRTLTYRSTAEDSGLEAWWFRPQHAEWKELMLAGRPFLLRRGMDWNTRTAGPKVAFFRFNELQMNEEAMSFQITDRVAECKK